MSSGVRKSCVMVVLLLAIVPGRCDVMDTVSQWSVWEGELAGEVAHASLPSDVTVSVRLTAPSGQDHRIDAFWDGGSSWRARFAPGEIGRWRWTSRCDADAGPDGASGEFECVGAGDGPLSGGPLRVAEDRRHFEHADGTAFFWLADTAWNGALRGDESDWAEYLSLRREQGFTAVQFVTTQWRGWPEAGVFDDAVGLDVNVAAFQHLDRMLAAVNAQGLVAAPVMLWTLTESDPGQTLSEENAIALCRYMVARWGAYNVVWLLGGDGRYQDVVERWNRIGRAVFGDESDRLVSMHPCGTSWVGEWFGDEPWFDFLGYQSGHGLPEKTSRWITQGPPAQKWRDLALPIVNLEPNYEGFPAYGSDHRISALDVRRAAWLSLLSTPTAGVSYGTNPIWVWGEETGDAPGHSGLKDIPPWRVGLETEGIAGMSALRSILSDVEWWRLRPAQEMLAEQPGEADSREWIAVAATEARDLTVAYAPGGGEVILTSQRRSSGRAVWRDPRDGSSAPAEGEDGRFIAPDDRDWVLVIAD
ncbi:MAG: DUF4038 domain-containing protein [Armatimonadota bacterium]